MMIAVILIGLVTGTLIGTVGVGGILLSPLLTVLLEIDLHVAMASSSLSFLFTGIVGTIAYARRGSVNWHMVKWLSLGIIPAALLGARVNGLLSTAVLTLILAALILFSGINVFFKLGTAVPTVRHLSIPLLVTIGLLVGFGSALTGTGGPVLLVPLLVTLSFPALGVIGVSQVIQLPIALFATLGFFLFGQIDLGLGVTLGVVQAIGVLLGVRVAHALPAERLRYLVGAALVGVGILLIGRTLL